jgi:hypothetical protein
VQTLDRRATWERFRGPALACTALLLLGYARLAPGARFENPRAYRVWSFGAYAYSDVIALHGDRGGGRHKAPYFHDRVEYPVLLGIHLWWPSVLAPNRTGYFALSYAALAVCALLSLWLLCGLPGTQPWAFAATPALTLYAGLNWDLFAILPMMLGIWLWAAGRAPLGTLALAAGACTKLFPVLALPPLLAREPPRRAAFLAAIAIAFAVVVNAPFAFFAQKEWLWFFEYNAGRDNEPSLYTLFGAGRRAFIPEASWILATAVMALTGAFILLRRRLEPRSAIAALLLVFLFFTRVWSPQYWLWVFAALALCGAPPWVAAAVSGEAVLDYVVQFGYLHLQFEGAWPQAAWLFRELFVPQLAIRYAVLGGCAGLALARSFRGSSTPAVAGGAVACRADVS